MADQRKCKNGSVPALRFEGFSDPWEQRRLGELLLFQNGFNGGRDSFGRGMPLISVMDVLAEVFITYDSIRGKASVDPVERDRYLVEYGDVLFQRSSENQEDAGTSNVYLDQGRPAIFGGFVIRGKRIADYDPLAMRYLLSSQLVRRQITSRAQGAQHINVSQDTLQDVAIQLPGKGEQSLIGALFAKLDSLITLHQRKVDKLKTVKQSLLEKMFPREGENVPEIRFEGFTDPWEQRKLGELYEKAGRKNSGEYGGESIISVANMRFSPADRELAEGYLETYNVMDLGDIAFEGNRSKHFAHGRFVENDIGPGIVSHVFDVFRPKTQYDLAYWKYAINNERVMGAILVRSTKASTMMHNLVAADFLKESMPVPTVPEQSLIGALFVKIDSLITLHQRELDILKNLKQALLEKMFV